MASPKKIYLSVSRRERTIFHFNIWFHTFVSLLGLLVGRFGENFCHLPLAWRADFATLTRASGLRVKNSSGETANHCEPKDQQPGEGLQKLRSERPGYQIQDDRSIDHWIGGEIFSFDGTAAWVSRGTLFLDSGLEATKKASVMRIPLPQASAIYKPAAL